jgi:uroporphyrin-III C-methyltransferase
VSRLGIVWLVGAGPGDPKLITVRGLEVLRAADAVVYDRLVPRALVEEAPVLAERHDVGKAPGHHTPEEQAEINALLVRLARQGKRVVRLKGGDAFVFGRGGEEACALLEAGVPWEVVPGVSAAIAAPAYAGIPLTHRGVSASFAVASGHPGIQPPALAHADTLVVLMAVGQLEAVVRSILGQGRPADTPAAVVQAASTERQRTITATLATIAKAARRARVAPPATLVIGPTVAFAKRLRWFREDG